MIFHRFLPFGVLLSLCVQAQEAPRPAPAKGPAAPRPASSAAVGTGAAQRNENIYINRIDNEALKEASVRLGTAVAVVDAPTPARSYFGAEFGKAPGEVPFLPRNAADAWHATLFEEHRNSVFNARTFFQAGPVKPSHANFYGVSAGGPAGSQGRRKETYLFLDASQRKVRGMVNGNILVPLAGERAPLATDPAARAVVARMLAAFKPELPDRPDIDPRALNTNSPQSIDDDRLLASVELPWLGGYLRARHLWTFQDVDAFQFVAGQNPDTTLRAHRARLTWEHRLAQGTFSLAAGFDRLHSLLVPEPNAFSNRVRVGFQIEELGPQPEFPIDRVENTFRWAAQAVLPRGSHRWIAGTDLARFRLNGRESYNSRGFFSFTSNFGRTALENLLLGVPSNYEVELGEFTRGFRNLEWNAYFGDTWQASLRWQLVYGLRYNLRTAPHEVNHRTPIPYSCDCNNFSPRFGFVYRLVRDNRDYGLVRAHYTVSFGEVFGVTYQMARFSPPGGRYVQVTNPSLLNPLAGTENDTRTGLFLLSPDLVAPYSHQYSFVWQREFQKSWRLQLGYTGSRSFKLLMPWITNRAFPIPGIPLTTETVNRRRPDASHYEINRITNSAIGYLDAGQLKVDFPSRHGLFFTATYTYGKAMDTGASYIGTAAHSDLSKGRSQSEFDIVGEKRGLSDFDSPHAFLAQYSYDLPLPARWRGTARKLLGGWQVSGATLMKTGTPFTLYVGSDSPGFGNVDGGPGDRPNVVDPSVLHRTINHPNTSQKMLPRSAFSYVRPGELRGNIGRNTFRKDGIHNWNLALARSWKLPLGNGTERSLTFRVETYNLGNHPQFDEPQRNLSAPGFGQITNTLNDGRVFQFVLRLGL